jgi:hypothetical protein
VKGGLAQCSPFKKVVVAGTLLGLSYRGILENPARLNSLSRDDVTEENISQPLSETWFSRTGRCTSFNLKVSTLLEERYPNFRYFSVGRHRVARCERTCQTNHCTIKGDLGYLV